MKRIFLTITIFNLASLAYGQTFAPIGAQWYYSASANGAAPTASEYYHYQSQLDTVVAAHICKKISITYYQYNGAVTYPSPVFTYQSGDTVFYYNNIYSRYFPLYIFNVSQGDTLTFHSPAVPVNPADTLWLSIVDSVTSFITGNDTLQRIWTTEPNIDAFSFWGGYIELLGCPFLMLPQPHVIFPEWDGPLRCYSDSNISHNFNSFPCDYHLTNGINEPGDPFGILIFPNPATDHINIQSSTGLQLNFKIYNPLGQLVKTGIAKGNTTAVYIDNLENGIYSIEFTANSKTEWKHFIVMNQRGR